MTAESVAVEEVPSPIRRTISRIEPKSQARVSEFIFRSSHSFFCGGGFPPQRNPPPTVGADEAQIVGATLNTSQWRNRQFILYKISEGTFLPRTRGGGHGTEEANRPLGQDNTRQIIYKITYPASCGMTSYNMQNNFPNTGPN